MLMAAKLLGQPADAAGVLPRSTCAEPCSVACSTMTARKSFIGGQEAFNRT